MAVLNDAINGHVNAITRQPTVPSYISENHFLFLLLPFAKAGSKEKPPFIMAKGLFASLKGVDAFGKVCYAPVFRPPPNPPLMLYQTTEDVKVKTRTGALCGCY